MNKGKSKQERRKTISLETKTTILKRIAEGKGSTALGREFGLAESTIRGIRTRAGEINKSHICATNESAKRASYSRNILIERTENLLIIWIQELTQKGVPIDGDLIKERAIQLFNQVSLEASRSSSHVRIPKFFASNGWLAGFLKRHALQNKMINGETTYAQETAADDYSTVLVKIEDGKYCLGQVSNAHKSDLSWKNISSRTSEKTASGFKAAKDRITHLRCSNASEARKLKRSMAEKTAWVTTEIVTPAHVIGGEGRSENVEISQDETVRNDDIINNLTDSSEEEPDYMTADNIYKGLQLCSKLERHFLGIDTNSERTSKFQKDLQSCISGYRDIYKWLVKQ